MEIYVDLALGAFFIVSGWVLYQFVFKSPAPGPHKGPEKDSETNPDSDPPA